MDSCPAKAALVAALDEAFPNAGPPPYDNLSSAEIILDQLKARGYVVVPEVATEAMLAVGDSDRPGDRLNAYLRSCLPRIWKEMIAAYQRG